LFVPPIFTESFKSVLLYYVSMVSLADNFAAALNDDLSGTNLSEGVDAASGSTSVLVSTETNTASIIGISAFCLDEIVGGNCFGGLVQGNVAAFGTRMCVEEILPVLGCCAVKSHDVKASLPESFTRAPQDKAWFLKGVSKGRRLVTVDRSWPISAVPEALLQTLKPLPVNAGEWVGLLDGLQATDSGTSVNAVQEFAARVKGHLMAVTPRTKKVRYKGETSATPESSEQFVELDSTQLLSIDPTASSATIQKKLREVLPVVVSNVDAIRASVEGVGRDLSSFRQAVGQDLYLQENVLSRV
jgi:hypothetical protein